MENIITYKRYICSNILELDKADYEDIYTFLVYSNVPKSYFNYNADGIRVNLNDIDDITITNLYFKIKHKLEKKPNVNPLSEIYDE